MTITTPIKKPQLVTNHQNQTKAPDMNEKSQNQSLFSNQQLKELSKPSLLTLLKYVDSMFKEKEGEILAPPGVVLTPLSAAGDVGAGDRVAY